jgi:hypothetical protein
MTGPTGPLVGDDELAALEGDVQRALAAGRQGGLAVLGYGEITLVLGWPPAAPRVACKRLPPFPNAARAARYLEVIDGYLAALRAGGVDVVPTELHALPSATRDGRVIGWAVQPILDPATLGPAVLRSAPVAETHPMLEAIAAATAAAVGPRTGLDAQLSNWAWDGARLRYLDVTTPFAWDADDRLLLDLDTLVAALPAPMRAVTKRFVAGDVIRKYRRARDALLDLCGNLHKERLEAWVPAAVNAANAVLGPADAPITVEEARRYYRGDARLWAFMLAARRADAAWQRRVRRRSYPFLLPGRIRR